MVLLAAQHVAHFERFDLFERRGIERVQLVGRGETLLDEVGHQLQVVRRRGDLVADRDPVFDPGYFLELLFGRFGVVPEIGVLCLALFFFQFDASVIDVKDASSTNPVVLQAL